MQLSLMNSKTLCLIKKVVKHKIKRIQSKKYKIGTHEIKKISLSWFGDERFVLDGDIHTLPYFYKDCKKQTMR